MIRLVIKMLSVVSVSDKKKKYAEEVLDEIGARLEHFTLQIPGTLKLCAGSKNNSMESD